MKISKYALLASFMSLLVTFTVHGQNQTGFISLDCGIPRDAEYFDERTKLYYSSDAPFIESGVNNTKFLRLESVYFDQQFHSLRSFPQGTRNCFTLIPAHGKGNKYLIRARFMYANYDGKGQLPEFDLHLGVELWDTVRFESPYLAVSKEIIHVASSDYVHVCLVNTGRGTQFISVLELRPLNNSMYQVTGSLKLLHRLDIGSTDKQIIRNMSSSGLKGLITPYITNLTMLESLDLSNNSLTGEVPDFLTELASLKALNLKGNNFTGSIPSDLLSRSKKGLLALSVDGDVVENNKHKRNNKLLVPIVATIATVVLLVLAAWTISWFMRKKNKKVIGLDDKTSKVDGSLEIKNRQFSFLEFQNMTNNFHRVVGVGGFGTVYHGHVEGTQVAVKMLSESSIQGYKEFQTEVKILINVHHKNLTSLVGYCNDGTHIGLIYEFMANGNLEQHLSDKNPDALSWQHRLQIAMDAAQGTCLVLPMNYRCNEKAHE